MKYALSLCLYCKLLEYVYTSQPSQQVMRKLEKDGMIGLVTESRNHIIFTVTWKLLDSRDFKFLCS